VTSEQGDLVTEHFSRIIRVSRVSMGTEFELLLTGRPPDYLRDAGFQALEEVARLEAQLSHYRADSDIRDLNLRAAYEAVRLEPALFRLLRRCVEISQRTGGAFDCTAAPLIRCWGFFVKEGRLPDPAEIEEARARVGSHLLLLDEEAHTVRFAREGVEVHLGAVGKGYAVDAAVRLLRELDVPAALLHGGTSTVYGLGGPAPGEDWRVGLVNPRDPERRLGVVSLRDRALSTSGDFEQYFEVEGTRYSHVLDPRTGRPAQGVRSAVVLAESATDSDALSTAFFVGGADGAGELCRQMPGLGAVLVTEMRGEPGQPSGETEVRSFGEVVLQPVGAEAHTYSGGGNR
jgi:FAD:protein FMN transferase